MHTREKVQLCLSDMENLRQPEKKLGGPVETVENLQLNSSCKAEEKITVQKSN